MRLVLLKEKQDINLGNLHDSASSGMVSIAEGGKDKEMSLQSDIRHAARVFLNKYNQCPNAILLSPTAFARLKEEFFCHEIKIMFNGDEIPSFVVSGNDITFNGDFALAFIESFCVLSPIADIKDIDKIHDR